MSDIFAGVHPPVNGRARKLALSAAGTVVIPQGACVNRIFVRNKTANAITGGLKIGTTAGGTDVLAAGAVGASALTVFAPLIPAVNASAARTLYFDAVTGWNSASIDIAVEYTNLL